MANKGTRIRWGVEQRLEFIEFRLYWEGGINRSDITEYFGVSVPQASKDLSQYQERAPGNMEYDKREKRYFAAVSFKPRFLDPDPDRYLSQLEAIGEERLEEDQSWLAAAPPVDCMPIPKRKVDAEILRQLLEAIREQQAIEIHYQSMNPKHPEPQWRGISPHAFGSDGFRWHVRAFCHNDRRFKDFLLSRMVALKPSNTADAKGSEDHDWNTYFEVKLKPNPALSESQQSIIAADFLMDNCEMNLPVRRALLYYFEKRLRFDVSRALDNPQEIPVVIANKDEFDAALAEVRG